LKYSEKKRGKLPFRCQGKRTQRDKEKKKKKNPRVSSGGNRGGRNTTEKKMSLSVGAVCGRKEVTIGVRAGRKRKKFQERERRTSVQKRKREGDTFGREKINKVPIRKWGKKNGAGEQ